MFWVNLNGPFVMSINSIVVYSGRSSVNWQSSSSWPQNSKRFGANKYRLNRAQQNQQETDENSMREMASIASQNGLPFRSNKPQYKNHVSLCMRK